MRRCNEEELLEGFREVKTRVARRSSWCASQFLVRVAVLGARQGWFSLGDSIGETEVRDSIGGRRWERQWFSLLR